MFENLKYSLKHNRRSTVRKLIAWGIFSAIILVFVFLGMNPDKGQIAQGGAAATVNDASISLLQYQDMLENLRRDPQFAQLQELGGDAGRQILQQRALSQLIELELIRQATDRQRLWTTNSEVLDILRAIPAFQEEGRFKPDRYRNYLSSSRKSASEFEEGIRREQSLNRMVKLFSASLKPLKLETERVKALAEMKTEIEFVAVPSESLVIPESINEADVKTFLTQAGSEAKIKDYFESHKQEFSSPERVKARHILVRAKAGDTKAEDAGRKKIEDLAKRAKTEDFGKLASQHSEDPGSKAKGGMLDFFSRGKMVPEFEQAAFSQPVNEIGAPVKTEYGYHLIQVLEKKPASNRTLDDVKTEIAGILIAKERSRQAVDTLQESLKKGDAGAVQKFVADHKLKWEATGPFSIETENVPKVGANDELVRLAFRLGPAKPLADGLVREGGRALIVRHKALSALKSDKDAKKSEQFDFMAEMASSRRAEDVIRKWLDELRKSSRISTNPQIFGRGA